MSLWERTEGTRRRITSVITKQQAIGIGKFISTLLLFALVVFLVDVEAVVTTVQDGDIRLFGLAVGVAITGITLSAAKWQILLQSKGEHRRFSETFRIYYVGKFFNLVLPSTIGGDAVRAYSMSKNVDQSVEAYSSIFVDRLTGLVALVAFALVGLALNLGMFSWRLSLPVAVVGTGTAVILFYAFSGTGGRQVRQVLKFAPLNLDETLVTLQQSVQYYQSKPKYLALAGGFALVFQSFSILTRYILALSLGIDIPLIFFLVMIPVTEIILFIPISIQGFGAREALYIFFLVEVGITPAQAVALSILVHVMTIISAVPGGLGVLKS